MRRVRVERAAELLAELGRRAVVVRFPRGGFGNRGVVEFGELCRILFGFAVGSIFK